MTRHDELEAALDDMSADHSIIDIIASLGEGFSEEWAQAYAPMLLEEWVKRGRANRRRYRTAQDKLKTRLKTIGKPKMYRLPESKPRVIRLMKSRQL